MTDEEKIYYEQIKNILVNVTYTHKTHERIADGLTRSLNFWKIMQIILDTLTLSTCVSTIADFFEWQKGFAVLSAILSFLAVLVSIRNKAFDNESLIPLYKKSANSFLDLRDSYQSLLIDIKTSHLTIDEIVARRDELQKQKKIITEEAPRTSSLAYLYNDPQFLEGRQP